MLLPEAENVCVSPLQADPPKQQILPNKVVMNKHNNEHKTYCNDDSKLSLFHEKDFLKSTQPGSRHNPEIYNNNNKNRDILCNTQFYEDCNTRVNHPPQRFNNGFNMHVNHPPINNINTNRPQKNHKTNLSKKLSPHQKNKKTIPKKPGRYTPFKLVRDSTDSGYEGDPSTSHNSPYYYSSSFL